MTEEEIDKYINQIAFSGAEEFLQKYKGQEGAEQIIGHFGLGFYSAFMVGDEVSVESKSFNASDCKGFVWKSDGSGEYTVSQVEESDAGSKIIIKLKENCNEFCDPNRIKDIIKRYSSFVSFPIKVDGEVANKVSAIWLQDKKSITEPQYKEFYKFIANAFDEPMFTLHFQTDAPIDLKALFEFF